MKGIEEEIPDGKPKQPTRRDTSAVVDGFSGLERLLVRLSLPETYSTFGFSKESPDRTGRPRDYPPELYSAVAALRDVHPEVRKLHRHITGNKTLIAAAWDGVLRFGQPVDEYQRAEWQQMRDEFAFPSRATLNRRLNDVQRDPQSELIKSNVTIAIELGYFQPHQDSPTLGRGRVMTADGTVFEGPSTVKSRQTKNPATGEIHDRRFDEMSHVYVDGTGKKIWGPKFAILGAQALPHLPYGISLAACHVVGRSPSDEVDVTLNLVEEVDRLLMRHLCKAEALFMDGAPAAKHILRLLELEMAAVCPPTRKASGRDGTDPIERIHHIGTFTTRSGTARLMLEGSVIYQLINVAGQSEKHQVAQKPKIIKRVTEDAVRQYLYVEVITLEGDMIRIPISRLDGRNGRPNETEEEHFHRLSLMRIAARNLAEWNETHGANRGTSERKNGKLDAAFTNKRIPAYGKHRQQCVITDMLIGEALDLLALHRAQMGVLNTVAYPDGCDGLTIWPPAA